MAATLRPLRLLAPVVLAAAACGSPSSPPGLGGEDGRRESPEDGKALEPQFEGGGAPAGAPARDRATDVKNFFAQRGVAIEAAAESAWVELGGEAALVITIRNGGGRRLTLLGERSFGTWPFDSSERGRVVFHERTIQASLAIGVQDREETRVEEWTAYESDRFVVEASATHSLRLPIASALAKDALAAEITVKVELHPLAVQFEGEPDRVVALNFAPVDLRFAPPRVALGVDDGGALLERALAEDPELVMGAALRAAQEGISDVVARLIRSLPGPDVKARRARFVALEWLTGKRFGGDVERWRGWWESDEGMRFGRVGDGGGR